MPQHRFKLIEGNQTQGLPVLATPGDVREVVQLLKIKPEGIPIVEATDAIRKRLFDPRKVLAYEIWGIISRVGDRIRLETLGWELAQILQPQARIYRTILDKVKPYRTMLESIQNQSLELVTFNDVANQWENYYAEFTDDSDARDLESVVTCFFHLCHAAEIGTATAGRKGQPTRLRVNQRELAAFLQAYPLKPDQQFTEEHSDGLAGTIASPPDHEIELTDPTARVFISYNANSSMVDCLREALQLAGLQCDVVRRTTAQSYPVAPEALKGIRSCQIGLFLVTPEDCEPDQTGNLTLTEHLQIEIGAAYVHFERRLVLLWNRNVPVKLNLTGISRCEFEGDQLDWSTGIDVLRAIKLFSSRSA